MERAEDHIGLLPLPKGSKPTGRADADSKQRPVPTSLYETNENTMLAQTLFSLLAVLAVNAQSITTPVSPRFRL